MPYNPRKKISCTIVDTTLDENVIWHSEFDDDFFCAISKFSEDLYCLTIEDMATGCFIERSFFTHKGKVTSDVVDEWKKKVEITVDEKYYLS